MDTILTTIRDHYADLDGRARRKEYWLFQLGIYGFIVVGAVLAVGMETVSEAAVWGVYAVFGLGVLFLIPPAIAVTVRRLHDTGRSGWFYLFNFIPYVGGFILLYFTVLDGDHGPNDYGPDPKNPHLDDEATLDDFADVLGD